MKDAFDKSRTKTRRFPIDCPNNCPYHRQWDMAIDDYTHVCDKLEMQMDEYDYGWGVFPLCPLIEIGSVNRNERCGD